MHGGGVSFGGGGSGNTIVYGSGAPSALVGKNGDTYIDTSGHNIYGPKTGGSWGSPTSLVGPAGSGGNTILYGSGAPSNGSGNNGDTYLDSTNHVLYGPKALGAWPTPGVSLAGTPGASGDPTLSNMELWGSGADGDLTMSSGSITLNRDMFYRNVTLSGTASVNFSGYRMHVSGILDISNAPANALHCNALAMSQTIVGSSGSQSGGPPAQIGTYFGGGTSAASGAGGTGVGNQAAAVSSNVGMNGGQGGAGGAGGASGTGNAGGASRNPSTVTSPKPLRRLDLATTGIMGGEAGAGGSGGGGDGTFGGNGGAPAAGGAGVCAIVAKTINRAATTAAGAISARGTKGGSFASSGTNGNVGGYGGAGGCGGGFVLVIYNALTGSQATGCIAVDGGDGSNGGNGIGTGVGGQGGQGGAGGRITVMDILGGTITETLPTSQAAAAAIPTGAGSAGSAGTAGVQNRVNL